MSKPGMSGPKGGRFQRPARWVRDLPIWTKLGLIMIVPTLATMVVGISGLVDQVSSANEADRARSLVVLAEDSHQLVHALQEERAGAVRLLTAQSDIDRLKTLFSRRQAETDTAARDYRFRRSTLAGQPTNLTELLNKIETELDDLVQTRARIAERTGVPLSITDTSYGILINDLLGIRDLSVQLSGDPEVIDATRAAVHVATAGEYLSQERTVILRTLAIGDFTSAVRREYIAKRTGLEQELRSFRMSANADQRALFDNTVTGPEFQQTLLFEGILDGSVDNLIPKGEISIDKWDSTMVERSRLMTEVEEQLNEQALDAATTVVGRWQRRVLMQTGTLLAALIFGVLFAWLVARSMARALRDLRQGALSVAQFSLPQAVEQLRESSSFTRMTPEQAAEQLANPLPVRSADEFGQVTEAFNAVHQVAVQVAAEQAQLRAGVATMFVNLARRSQILVDRLINHLDRLERGEQDPDRLSELFQLDHLATRMRRNDENLLVLASADSTRVQREPAALIDVLRAAQSEVEHYTRIVFGSVDPDLEVAAHAVNDLVHLVAELLDNATAFSAPDTAVTVSAYRLSGETARLRVEDRGIGMSEEQYAELNERLAAPPSVDATVSRMMGLVVVSRLASRHEAKVELGPAPDRGSVAEVLLPAGVLVPRVLSGRSQAPAGFPAARPAGPSGPDQSGFAQPLALEAGSHTPPPPAAASFYEPGGDPEMTSPGLRPPTAPVPPAAYGHPQVPPASSGPQAPDSAGLGAALSGEYPVAPSSNGGPGWAGNTGSRPGWAGNTGNGPGWAGNTGNGPGWAGNTGNGPGWAGNSDQTGTLPAWHDLTAADTGPEDPYGDPLPQRQATPGSDPAGFGQPRPAGWPGPDQSETREELPPPGQLWPSPSPSPTGGHAGAPAAPQAFVPPVSAPPVPPVSAPPVPPVSAPPAHPVVDLWGPANNEDTAVYPSGWPLTSEPASESQPAPADAGVPSTPGPGLVHAETDASRPAQGQSVDPLGAGPLGTVPAPPSRYADDLTMELPIFRELESAWFSVEDLRPAGTAVEPEAAGTASGSVVAGEAEATETAPTAPSAEPRTGGAANGPSAGGAVGGARSANKTVQWSSGVPSSSGAARRPGGVTWRTVADDGWQAAQAASQPDHAGSTEKGLPRRVPMAQLVPGGVDNARASTQRRSPDAVRGLLSAYHRGVQRGRGAHDGSTSSSTPATPSTHSGKEQEA